MKCFARRMVSMAGFRSSMLMLVVLFTCVLSTFTLARAQSRSNKKASEAKSDGLAAYLQQVSAKALPAAPTTPGSLWTDSGRLANMVTDYKASRVGDLVTISVAQNLSATTTGNVSTNRSFTASSGISAL